MKRPSAYTVRSVDRQRLTMEAYQEKLEREPLQWKRLLLETMIRRLERRIAVNAANGHHFDHREA